MMPPARSGGDSERKRRAEDLYRAAMARPAADRRRFLGDACAGDERLLRDVSSLLAQTQDTAADGAPDQPTMIVPANWARERGLLAGRRLGPYEIGPLIGAGGMGEVYRARDARLRRDVAIKVLPAMFTADPERLARFEREARILAALDHPHIEAIYGLEESDGIRALVLEFVDGETLAARIARGALPCRDALDIARQIADALETAHQKGIIHRDLKPANVKLTPAGKVKVLDFGLAKNVALEVAGDEPTRPSITFGTRDGLVIGTFAYMSPEQAKGQRVDLRSDMWAFGCVLFEMLAGRSPFAAGTIADTLAAIADRPPDWRALPAATPRIVVRLLEECLEKDRTRRARDIGAVRAALDRALSRLPADGAMGLQAMASRMLRRWRSRES
jgi:serine/threonine protein kinase